MSRMAEFIAFKAAVALLKERGLQDILEKVYKDCIEMAQRPSEDQTNCVKEIYKPFTDKEISAKIAELLTPADVNAKVEIVYQTLQGLHDAVPSSPGDWYFSGDYPTPGGTRLVNQAYINFYEGKNDKR